MICGEGFLNPILGEDPACVFETYLLDIGL
jgi:hypothetical protein